MDLDDWAKLAAVASFVVALIGGIVGWLERRLNQMGTAQEQRSAHTRELIEKLDRDLDGLTNQLGAVRDDAQKRYLPRDEHTESVRQLREAMADLAQTMRNSMTEFATSVRDLSRQMFELARSHTGSQHDPDRR